MYAPERQQAILGRARAEGRVDVTSLAGELDVTSETIRRDLRELERRGVLRRVHGGAIAVERRLGIEPAVEERYSVQADAKERIAKAAVEHVLGLLPDGGSLLLDAGTTTVRFADLLPMDRSYVIVTHALPIATLMVGRPNITVHLVGGQVRPGTLAAVGPWAERAFAEVSADVAVAGTNGISARRGVTTPDMAEAATKRAILRSARQCVLLADSSKFGRDEFAHVADLTEIDTIITDSEVASDMVDEIRTAGPEVVEA